MHLTTERDLSRQVVKSDYASITVPEIDLEIPCLSQKGEITTVEGKSRGILTLYTNKTMLYIVVVLYIF